VLVVAEATAVIFLPFVVFKSNRIVRAFPRGLLEVLPAWDVCRSGNPAARRNRRPRHVNARVRLGAALLAWSSYARRGRRRRCAHTRRQQGGARRSRRRFLGLLVCLGLMAADAITRMRPGPGLRVLFSLCSPLLPASPWRTAPLTISP